MMHRAGKRVQMEAKPEEREQVMKEDGLGEENHLITSNLYQKKY